MKADRTLHNKSTMSRSSLLLHISAIKISTRPERHVYREASGRIRVTKPIWVHVIRVDHSIRSKHLLCRYVDSLWFKECVSDHYGLQLFLFQRDPLDYHKKNVQVKLLRSSLPVKTDRTNSKMMNVYTLQIMFTFFGLVPLNRCINEFF